MSASAVTSHDLVHRDRVHRLTRPRDPSLRARGHPGAVWDWEEGREGGRKGGSEWFSADSGSGGQGDEVIVFTLLRRRLGETKGDSISLMAEKFTTAKRFEVAHVKLSDSEH